MAKRQYNFGQKYNGYAGWPGIRDPLVLRILQMFEIPARLVASLDGRLHSVKALSVETEKRN